MITLVSYCGSCKEKVPTEAFKNMFKGNVETLNCGHENKFEDLFTPLREEFKEVRNAPKRSTWYLLTADEVEVGNEKDSDVLVLHTEAGAWDAYHAGQVQGTPLFLYSFKIVHRFMDFDPRVKQSGLAEFDSKEFEGFRFVSKDLDPGSLGVVVKKSHLKLLTKREVTVDDAPESPLA